MGFQHQNIRIPQPLKSLKNFRSAFLALATTTYVFIGASHAQTISHHVLGSSSGMHQSQESSLDWTIGEFAVATFSDHNALITEGFHQPRLSVTPISASDLEAILDISVYPNPFTDIIHIKFNELVTDGLAVLHDIRGREVMKTVMDSDDRVSSLDLQNLATASYILTVTSNEKQIQRSFRIVKASR